MVTQTQDKAQVQATKTCAKCPYFDPNQGRHGWCGVFGQAAKPYHKSTEICDQEVLRLQSKANRSVEKVRDSVSHQQKPTHVDEAEYEQGRCHGQNDASQGWHPIYKEPVTAYAIGYLIGYNEILNPAAEHLEASKPLSWSVCLDPRWGTYQAWFGSCCIGHASTDEEAQQLATRYIATNETIRRQNAKVMAAYAG